MQLRGPIFFINKHKNQAKTKAQIVFHYILPNPNVKNANGFLLISGENLILQLKIINFF